MAKKTYRWPDGSYHTIPWTERQQQVQRAPSAPSAPKAQQWASQWSPQQWAAHYAAETMKGAYQPDASQTAWIQKTIQTPVKQATKPGGQKKDTFYWPGSESPHSIPYAEHLAKLQNPQGAPPAQSFDPGKFTPQEWAAYYVDQGTQMSPEQEQWASKQLGFSYDSPAPAPTGQIAGDSEYFSEAAKSKFQTDQELAGLTQEESFDATDHQEALRRLLEGRPKDTEKLKEAYAKMGLLYSGKLGEAQGEVEKSYSRQQSDLQMYRDRRKAARAAARTALEQGASIEQAALRAAAVDRQIAKDEESAQAGILAPDHQLLVGDILTNAQRVAEAAPKPARTAADKAKSAKRRARGPFRTIKSKGKTYHYYPKTGEKILVKK